MLKIGSRYSNIFFTFISTLLLSNSSSSLFSGSQKSKAAFSTGTWYFLRLLPKKLNKLSIYDLLEFLESLDLIDLQFIWVWQIKFKAQVVHMWSQVDNWNQLHPTYNEPPILWAGKFCNTLRPHHCIKWSSPMLEPLLEPYVSDGNATTQNTQASGSKCLISWLWQGPHQALHIRLWAP